MSFNLKESFLIYSPAMAFFGYLLIFSIFFYGTLLPVIFPIIPLTGAFIFLNYLREKSTHWWIGIPYPLLLLVILIMEFIYAFLPGLLYEIPIFAPVFKIIFYLLIAPASLFLFAAMTKEFRKILKVPLAAVSVVTALILLIPFYNMISGLIFPGSVAYYAMTDVTPGFIVIIFVGFLAIPLLLLTVIIFSFRISDKIRAELTEKREE